MDDSLEKTGSLIGTKGKGRIRRELSRALPSIFIPRFQETHGLQPPITADTLAFLKLLGLSRADVCRSIIASLIRRLRRALDSGNKAQAMALLEQSFSFLAIEEVRAIPISCLQSISPLPQRILQSLAANPKLTKDVLPGNICRAVCESDRLCAETVLQMMVQDILKEHDKDSGQWIYENIRTNSLPDSLEWKFPLHCAGYAFCQLIEPSANLSEAAVRVILNEFAKSSELGLCRLTAELIRQSIRQADDKRSSLKRLYEWMHLWEKAISHTPLDEPQTQSLHDQIYSSTSSSIIGVSVLVLHHPALFHTILRNIKFCLQKLNELEGVPSESQSLKFFTQFLVMSIFAPEIVKKISAHSIEVKSTNDLHSQASYVLKAIDTFCSVDPLLLDFFPMVIEWMLLIEIQEEITVKDTMLEFVNSPVAVSIIWMIFIDIVQSQDSKSMKTLLPLLNATVNSMDKCRSITKLLAGFIHLAFMEIFKLDGEWLMREGFESFVPSIFAHFIEASRRGELVVLLALDMAQQSKMDSGMWVDLVGEVQAISSKSDVTSIPMEADDYYTSYSKWLSERMVAVSTELQI